MDRLKTAQLTPAPGSPNRGPPMTTAIASQSLTLTHDLPLDCGQSLAAARIAFETYGELNADKSNAVLVCHALTGDQYVASNHPITGKPGWWERLVGRSEEPTSELQS